MTKFRLFHEVNHVLLTITPLLIPILILIQKYITIDAEPLIKPTISIILCSCNNIILL